VAATVSVNQDNRLATALGSIEKFDSVDLSDISVAGSQNERCSRDVRTPLKESFVINYML
jgi:hypothetical protein